MQIRISKRRLFVAMLIVIVFWWIFGRFIYHDPNAIDAAGYVMPGVVFREMNILDSWQYVYYIIHAHFGSYPLVIRISFYVLIACIGVGLLIMLYAIYLMVKSSLEKSIYEKMKKEWLTALTELVLFPSVVDSAYVAERLKLNGKSLNMKESNLWLRLLVHIYTEEKLNYTMSLPIMNINQIARELHLTDFVIRVFTTGSPQLQLITLDSVSFIHLDVPVSMLARLVNSGNPDVRKRARIYYAKMTTLDPYTVFREDFIDKYFKRKDAMEMHEVIRRAKEANRLVPSFSQMMKATKVPQINAILITMFGTWCADEELVILKEHFYSQDSVVRQAAYEVVGDRKYIGAEEILMSVYKRETEDLRRVILDVVMKVASGKAEDFLKTAYELAKSKLTLLKALQALYQYNDATRKYYFHLRANATEEDIQLYHHVEALCEWPTITKSDADMSPEKHRQIVEQFLSNIKSCKPMKVSEINNKEVSQKENI